MLKRIHLNCITGLQRYLGTATESFELWWRNIKLYGFDQEFSKSLTHILVKSNQNSYSSKI